MVMYSLLLMNFIACIDVFTPCTGIPVYIYIYRLSAPGLPMYKKNNLRIFATALKRRIPYTI